MREYEVMVDGDIYYYKDFNVAWVKVGQMMEQNGFNGLTKEYLNNYLNDTGSYTFDIFNQIKLIEFKRL